MSQHALCICEKPSLMHTIEEVYKRHKSEFSYTADFVSQRGHLLRLKNPTELDPVLKKYTWDTLPIEPETLGGWQYTIIEEKRSGNFKTAKERYDEIKSRIRSGDYDFVINAGDPEQEGELLIRIVLDHIGNTLPIRRFWSNDLSEKSVLAALKDLKDDEHDPMLVNLLSAAYARQHSDYRYGMNISRAASIQMNGRAACGRVKTPLLSIITYREKEIRNFKESVSFGVEAFYKEGFKGEYVDETKTPVRFDDRSDAKEICDTLSGHNGTVVSFTKKQVKTQPPKLFKLATAQIEAGKMGFNDAFTLKIIQGLYEKKLLTYPRTDCEYLSSNEDLRGILNAIKAVPECSGYEISDSTIGSVRKNKRWVNDKALEESGHSALCPTTIAPDFSSLTSEEIKIYTMISKRFLAIFLPPLVEEKEEMLVDIYGKSFLSTGKILISEGFTALLKRTSSSSIPEKKEGDTVAVKKIESVEHKAKCPERFTSPELIAVCENPGKYLDDKSLKKIDGTPLKIGTPATRSGIIRTLIDTDHYVEEIKDGKKIRLKPTRVGELIADNLSGCSICKVDMTGQWEEKLSDVRSGKMSPEDLESFMRNDVCEMIGFIKNKEMKPIHGSTIYKETSLICPQCGNSLTEADTRYFCSCKFVLWKTVAGHTFTEKELRQLIETGSTDLLTFTSKKGKDFKANLILKDGKTEFSFPETVEETFRHPCPFCGGEMKDNGRVITCTSCETKIWRTLPGNKTLSDKDLDLLFTEGKTKMINGMISKKGKRFSAKIVLDARSHGTKFEF